MMHHSSRHARRDRHSRRGGVALGAALLLVPLSLLAGIGVDYGRAYVAQAQLAQAVDAGALAGARVVGLRDPAPDARMYFDANLEASPGFERIESFSATPDASGNTVTVAATAAIRTTFLRLAGENWRTLPVTATATARRTTMGMELALVLDVTGSMDGDKINQLRLAAADLVNILFGSKNELDTLYVSVVPYTATVNLGHNREAWLGRGDDNGADPALWNPDGTFNFVSAYRDHSWRGCVEARRNGEDQTDTPPGEAPFRPFLYPSTRQQTSERAFGTKSNGNPNFGDADWGADPAITSTESPDADDTRSLDPLRSYTTANERKGPNVGCGQPVSGLTNDRAAIQRIIAALEPSHRGGTMGNLGLQVGWMTLSPRWQGLWGTSVWGTATPDGLPLATEEERTFMTKVIVMMTDGENQWYDYHRPPAYDYTAYGRLPEGRLGTTSRSNATRRIDERMSRLCENIKDAGITIYTITLGTNTSTQQLYRDCATSSNHYFHAPTPTKLRDHFREIGTQLANLRLEQ